MSPEEKASFGDTSVLIEMFRMKVKNQNQ